MEVRKGHLFDPSKPVVISDFIPKEGGWGSRLLLYGNNFGDDPTKVKVTIGGKEAKVITVTNDNLYCFVHVVLMQVILKSLFLMGEEKNLLMER